MTDLMDDIQEIEPEKAMVQNAMAAHMWYLEYESASRENERLNSRVAELEDQIGSAMMDGHDMAKNEYRDIISNLEARVAELESRELECSEYLKDGETPRQRMDRDQSDVLGLMKLLEREKYKSESARDKALEEAADCAIDNHDCDAWEIAAIIRAMKRDQST